MMPANPAEQGYTVLYLLGSGRSGSTLLERLFNSADGISAVGELHALWRLPLEALQCSCGEPVRGCACWQQTLEAAGIAGGVLANLARLEHSVIRNPHLMRLCLQSERIAADPRISEFLFWQHRLFAALRLATGSNIIVDSSKAGPRARVLASGLRVDLVHLYRHAEAVLASWRKPKIEPASGLPMQRLGILRAATDWAKVELTARSLQRHYPLRSIDYAAFAQAPRSTLERLLPELAGNIAWQNDHQVRPGTSYHSVLGNPDRFEQGLITITPRHASDRAAFSRTEWLAIQLVGAILQRLFPPPATAACACARHS